MREQNKRKNANKKRKVEIKSFEGAGDPTIISGCGKSASKKKKPPTWPPSPNLLYFLNYFSRHCTSASRTLTAYPIINVNVFCKLGSLRRSLQSDSRLLLLRGTESIQSSKISAVIVFCQYIYANRKCQATATAIWECTWSRSVVVLVFDTHSSEAAH